MKKRYIFSMAVLGFMLLIGCQNTHFDTLELPYRYGEARWVSESPDMWFDVHDTDKDEYYMYPEGKMKVGEKEISFVMSFPGGSLVFLSDMKGNVLIKGSAEYSPEKLIIHVSKDLSKYFVGETLVFDRISQQEESETAPTETASENQ